MSSETIAHDSLPPGKPLQEYRLSVIPGKPGSIGCFFTASLALVVAGLVCLTTPASVTDRTIIGSGFFFLGILGISLYFIKRKREYVGIYPAALVYFEGDKYSVLRWDKIEALIENPADTDGLGTSDFTIQRIDGFQAKLEHFSSKRLLDTVKHEVHMRQLPRIIQKLEAGDTVKFGGFWFIENGLQQGDITIPWREIAVQYNYSDDAIQIIRHRDTQGFAAKLFGHSVVAAKASISKTPNAFMLKALADHFQKAESSQNP